NNFSFVYQIRQLVNQQEQTIMTIENLAQINKTLWSPDQSQIIVWATEKNSSNTSPQKFIININQQTISKSTIPSDNIAWTPDSQHIYYVFSDIKTVDEQPPSDLPEGAGWVPTISFGTNNNMLTSANPDGSNWQNIIKLDEHNIFDPILVPSPDNNYIIIISNNHQVYIFDRQNNIVNQFATSESVTDASWSPDSQKILLETYNEKYNPQLVLTALNSNTNQSTNIQTFLSKSTWMNDHELICAIPNYLEQGPYSELPSTIDYFKIIDFNQPSNNTDYPYSTTQLNNTNQVANTAIDLSFNTNNNSLYYIDYDDILYFIPKTN
nr:hypothetical protein [bacterium]